MYIDTLRPIHEDNLEMAVMSRRCGIQFTRVSVMRNYGWYVRVRDADLNGLTKLFVDGKTPDGDFFEGVVDHEGNFTT